LLSVVPFPRARQLHEAPCRLFPPPGWVLDISGRCGLLVNACVMLRSNNFDPLVLYLFLLTVDNLQGSRSRLCCHAADGCSHPTLRLVVSTWTRCGGRLAPRRANEGYTAEPAALARLVCQAYHRRPGRTPCRPPKPRLAHSGCQQSRAAPPQATTVRCFPTPGMLRRGD
jgi:hypothetical protein